MTLSSPTLRFQFSIILEHQKIKGASWHNIAWQLWPQPSKEKNWSHLIFRRTSATPDFPRFLDILNFTSKCSDVTNALQNSCQLLPPWSCSFQIVFGTHSPRQKFDKTSGHRRLLSTLFKMIMEYFTRVYSRYVRKIVPLNSGLMLRIYLELVMLGSLVC